jgi:hypothetical protein
MDKQRAQEVFLEIKTYYDSIAEPKYRNADLTELKEKYEDLLELKEHLGYEPTYERLVNAFSQIISKLEKQKRLSDPSGKSSWSNLSERGMNKVIPPVRPDRETKIPIEWTDKWGNNCYVSNGEWTARNYRVMDALGNMFLLKEGGNRLPEAPSPIFDDLYEIVTRENQLNQSTPATSQDQAEIVAQSTVRSTYTIGFRDSDFRKFTGLELSSSGILELLLETSRVEFKLSFPVRLKSTGNKENIHRMNFFSRFFELGFEEIQVRKDGIVQERQYRVRFNTLLGELFVNNLKARYNDRIELKFYTLPDSAQVFYRRVILHNSFSSISIHLWKIAEAVGLTDSNPTNLVKTVESNILEPLKQYGYIEGYERTEGLEGIKYVITRKPQETPSEKDVGSVKEGCRVCKKRM